jgi:hypothetical protein
LTKTAIVTVDPIKFTVTNAFAYDKIFNIQPDDRNDDQFSFEMEKTVFTYSCSFRSYLLCQLYECLIKYSTIQMKKIGPFDAVRLRKSSSSTEARCRVLITAYGLIEYDSYNNMLQEYKWYNLIKAGWDDASYAFFFEYCDVNHGQSNPVENEKTAEEEEEGPLQTGNNAIYKNRGRYKIFATSEYMAVINAIKFQLKGIGWENYFPVVFVSPSLNSVPSTSSAHHQHHHHHHHHHTISQKLLSSIVQQRSDFYASIPVAVSVFEVNKVSKRYSRPIARQLHISEQYLLEMDSAGFNPISCHRIDSIYALVRSWENSRHFKIEYDNGSSSFFSSSQRDTLLAMLLDVCRASGNAKVSVTGEVSDGLRVMPRFAIEHYTASIKDTFFGSSSIETWYLSKLSKILKTSGGGGHDDTAGGFLDVCREFNANIVCPGLSPSLSDASLVLSVLIGLLINLQNEVIKAFHASDTNNARIIVIFLQTLYRLLPSTTGYKSFVEIKEVDTRQLLYHLLQYDDDFVNYWTLEILMTLCRCPLVPRNMQQEYVNKHTLLSDSTLNAVIDLMSNRFASASCNTEKSVSPLQIPSEFESNAGQKRSNSITSSSSSSDMVESHQDDGEEDECAERNSFESKVIIEDGDVVSAYLNKIHFVPNSLVVIGAAALLESLICSKRDTTSPELFQQILDKIMERAEILIVMLRSNSFLIMENAAILMFVLMKHRSSVSPVLKELALSECLVLKHFYNAIFSSSSTQRFISRFLVATWMNGNEKQNPAKALLFRTLPSGLIEYLKFAPISDDQRVTLDAMEEEYYMKQLPSSSKSRQNKELKPSVSSIDSSVSSNGFSMNNVMQERMRNRISGAVKGPSSSAVSSSPKVSVSSVILSSSTSASSLSSSTSTKSPPVSTSKLTKSTPENYRILFHMITQDHKLPDLIWNEQTRLELRYALEHEIKEYDQEQRLLGKKKIAWNYQQFVIRYSSLFNEMKVGNIYIRYFLDAGESFLRQLENPSHVLLFEKLFRRILVNLDSNSSLAVLCAKCLIRLYDVCYDLIPGGFDDMMIIVKMLESSNHLELQQYLIDLLISLSKESSNLHQLLDKYFVDVLIKYVSLAHINPDQIGNVLARATSTILMIKNDESSASSSSSATSPGATSSTVGGSIGGRSEEEESDRQHKRTLWIPDDISCPKVWYIAPSTSPLPPSKHLQKGPYRVSELMSEVETNRIDVSWFAAPATTEEADDSSFLSIIDTGRWKPIREVFQLRIQMLFPGKAIYSPSQIAFKGLKLLSSLSNIHKTNNTKGIPFYPLPLSKRIMSEYHHLAIFSTLLLSNDPSVVDMTSDLVRNLVELNHISNSKLYLTGLFYFACRYSGSNYGALSHLLSVTHLKQSFHDSAISFAKELPIHSKSVLGSILPSAMISVLHNYGPERFASIMIGDYDTPEVIWNQQQRKHMIEMIDQHLGDYPLRLKQFSLSSYDYCPIAKIHYAFLDKEIYVHEYYLKNLCDERRFPSWPIAEPLILLRECLERWHQEMSKSNQEGVDSTVDEARVLLKLPSNGKYSNLELRKAYKMMARQYHPDKNPAGREMFEKIHLAYELLSSIELKENEMNYDHIILLMKTQIILYRRYPSLIADQKYPAYSLLISVMMIPADNIPLIVPVKTNKGQERENFTEKVSEEVKLKEGSEGPVDATKTDTSCSSSVMPYTGNLLLATSALLFYSTSVSPLNSVELVRTSQGLMKLYSLFRYVLPFITSSSSSTASSPSHNHYADNSNGISSRATIYHEIAVNCIKTLSIIANQDEGRDAMFKLLIEADKTSFLFDLYSLLQFYHSIPFIVEHVIEVLSRLSSHTLLQKEYLSKSGILWRLIPFLLEYDNTFEDSSSESHYHSDIVEDGNGNRFFAYNQLSSNLLANLAAKATGRLGGYMFDELATADNPLMKQILSTLLTPSIAILLRNRRAGDLLRALNENIESPTKIWNIKMRKELLEYVREMDKKRKKGIHSEDLEETNSNFQFSNLKEELFIGNVYIRIFNKTADSSDIEDPSLFCFELLYFIGKCLLTNYSRDISLRGKDIKKNLNVGDEEKEEKSEDKTGEEVILIENLSELQRIQLTYVIEALKIILESRSYTLHDLINHPHGIFLLFALLNVLSVDGEAFLSLSHLFNNLCSTPDFVVACISYTNSQIPILWRWLKCLCNSSSFTASSSQQSFSHLWNALESFSANPDGLSCLLSNGLIIRCLGTLLAVKGYNTAYTNRLAAISLITKCLWNAVKGHETSSWLRRFLPEPLVILLKKSIGKSSLQLIDNVAENPELIWTQDMQNELREGILFIHEENIKKQQQEQQSFSLSVSSLTGYHDILQLPSSDYHVHYAVLDNEIFIGNVYIRIYLKQPSFKLSNPIYFMEKIIENYDFSFNTQVPKKGKSSSVSHPPLYCGDPSSKQQQSQNWEVIVGKEDFLSLLTSCMICALKNEHSLTSQLVSWGFLETLITDYLYRINLYQRKGIPLISVLRLLNELVNFHEMIDFIAIHSTHLTNNIITNLAFSLLDEVDESPADNNLTTNGIESNNHSNVKDSSSSSSLLFFDGRAVSLYKEAILIIEIFKKLFACYQNPNILILLRYALSCQLPSILLLHIINIPLSALQSKNITNASALRIHTVDLLKSMLLVANEEMHAELQQLLSQSKAWKEYKDQNHDLFIKVHAFPILF